MAALIEGGAETGALPTLRQARDVPDTLKKRAVAGQKTARRKLNKTRRKVLSQSKMTVSQKISLLMREGMKQRQAVAVALSMQRRGQLRK